MVSVKQQIRRTVDRALEPQIERLHAEIRQLQERIDELQAASDRMTQVASDRIGGVETMLAGHLPRPDDRPGFLAQYNLADVLAWRAAETSAAFVEEHMRTAQMLDGRRENLAFAAEHAPVDGCVLEFGVGAGESLGWLEATLSGHQVVGFDSFEGLPEDWRTGFEEGAFGDVGITAFERAQLQVGWFDEVLPPFMEQLQEPIALLHVDCDLYSSTKTVLEACMPRLAPGAIVVFDEFFNYQGWEHHEAKAWLEYLGQHRLDVEYLAFVPSWEQVTVRVTG